MQLPLLGPLVWGLFVMLWWHHLSVGLYGEHLFADFYNVSCATSRDERGFSFNPNDVFYIFSIHCTYIWWATVLCQL